MQTDINILVFVTPMSAHLKVVYISDRELSQGAQILRRVGIKFGNLDFLT